MNPVRLLSLRQVENSGPRDDRRRGTPDLLIEHFSRMPPADVPDPSTCHHAWCRPVGEARVGSEEDAPVSSEEEKNMALVRRFFEAQANADLDTLDELLAPDFVDHGLLPGQEPSREGYKQQVAEQIAALSDVRFVIEDQLAKGDKVVTRITWRSVHDRGEYFGLMPRGTEVEVTAMAMHRIVEDKIAEEWSEGSGSAEVAQAHLEQEIRERERVEQDLKVARSNQQASLPKEVPELEGWQISPFYQPGRWEETSTTSTSSLRVDWDSWWGMPRARACQRLW